MKKFMTFIAAAMLLTLCRTAFAENGGYVIPKKSSLANYINLDFANRYLGSPVKEIRLTSGNGSYKIIKENDETFLRLENYSDEKDCYFYFDLQRFASGEIAVEFDARFSSINYMQVPSVVGISDDKKSNADLTRVVLSSNGTVSLDSANTAKLSSSDLGKWIKFVIYINTESDTAQLFVDDNISAQTKTLSEIYKISSLRFLVRGAGQKVDINNFKVFDCKLNQELLNNPSDAEEKGLALPLRYKKESYVITKANGNILADADMSDWDNSLYVRLEKAVIKGSKAEVYAAAKYDDDGFYFALKARDDVPVSGIKDKPQLSDSFEIYIDGKDENTAFYQNNDIHLTVPYGESEIYCFKETDGAVYKYAKTDYGWCAEVFVPYSLIDVKLSEGDTIGLDFGYNDFNKDKERQGQFMWSGSLRNSTSTTAFGTAILS